MSYCIVSSEDSSTQLTCDGLRGGTDNTFQTGDEYLLSGSSDKGNFGPTEHIYIDDVIVNSSRIGPTYFELLYGQDGQKFTTTSGSSIKVGSGTKIRMEGL
jgi:hypothetical protein